MLYADDILLLTHSLNAVLQMLRICEEFATEFDMKFNSSKSVMRIGERYKVKCEPLMLAGRELQFVQSLKYLGAQFVAAKKLKCSVDNVRLKFTPGAKELNLRWSHYNCLNRIAYHLCYMRLR